MRFCYSCHGTVHYKRQFYAANMELSLTLYSMIYAKSEGDNKEKHKRCLTLMCHRHIKHFSV